MRVCYAYLSVVIYYHLKLQSYVIVLVGMISVGLDMNSRGIKSRIFVCVKRLPGFKFAVWWILNALIADSFITNMYKGARFGCCGAYLHLHQPDFCRMALSTDSLRWSQTWDPVRPPEHRRMVPSSTLLFLRLLGSFTSPYPSYDSTNIEFLIAETRLVGIQQ